MGTISKCPNFNSSKFYNNMTKYVSTKGLRVFSETGSGSSVRGPVCSQGLADNRPNPLSHGLQYSGKLRLVNDIETLAD